MLQLSLPGRLRDICTRRNFTTAAIVPTCFCFVFCSSSLGNIMSFARTQKLMREGDTVLLYLGFDNLVPVKLTRGSVNQNRYGALKHDRLIGAPYGVKVDCPKGWLYPLQPTSELWTLALPHRTQILYTPDISMIVLQLGLKPGSVVVEAGTGSGSLSHALIRSVMPTGRLHTFEFHAERCAAAQKEFQEHGLGDCVTAKHRDVCAQGFELVKEADAVFLDLPSPWDCVGHAKKALKSGGRICSFSPCMEQVQQTCQTLTQHGFTNLVTLECLARPFSVHNVKLPHVDFGDQVAPPSTDQSNIHRQTRAVSDSQGSTAKAAKIEEGGDRGECMKDVGKTNSGSQASSEPAGAPSSRAVPTGCRKGEGREFRTGAPPEDMQGHTGFLTFASVY
ncbi:tRNA (adenine(58)-N(1))-methyltransferase catalytic subunit TRMT61A-like [Babylonia areolata]|uniref:tRNA (adenine(58)-N(1))-methyltransferase catalytic subunit TRMT61A-like n=1 Tax=Babylonia areolata TaxID=304850 RepID=UPI003FD3A182